MKIGLPVDASRHGHLIDSALGYTAVCTVVLFLAIASVLVVSMVAHREGRSTARYDHGGSRRSLIAMAILLGTVFVVVDAVELARAYRDLTQVFWRSPSGPDVVRVEVLAQQWSWSIRQAGSDGVFNTPDDIVTLDELSIPVDRPVLIQLRSKDVIHSLYLPNMRIKQDAVPGMTTRLWFIAEQPGVFEFGCSQHCGANHYKMRGDLAVLDAAAYDRDQVRAAAATKSTYDPNDADAHWGWDWDAPR